jgi:hypothetical protein
VEKLLPSVIAGGSTAVVTFSFTRLVARRRTRPSLLVLAYRHSHSAAAAAKGCIATKARHPARYRLDVLLALSEEVKHLRYTLPGVAPNYHVHHAPLSWLLPRRFV